MLKKIAASSVLVLTMTVILLGPAVVFAQPGLGLNYAVNTGLQASTQDPRDTAVSIIRYIMTFLGIIATAIILLGGFRWMTAAGNEDKVSEAKKLLTGGVVGLIIILASFAIVNFIVQTTSNAISGNF